MPGLQNGDLRGMAINRRTFLWSALGIGAVVAIPAAGLIRRILNSKSYRAIRGWRYPGPLKKLDLKEVAKVSKWVG